MTSALRCTRAAAARDAKRQARETRAEYEVQALTWEPCLACGAPPPLSVEFGGRGRARGMAVVVCSQCGWTS